MLQLSESRVRRRVVNGGALGVLRRRGVFKSSSVGIHSDESNDEGVKTATIGATHEFGSVAANIPMRSWFRSTLREQLFKMRRTITEQNGVRKTAVLLRNEFKKKINSNISPELEEATIRAKTRGGRVKNRSLVDSGTMRQSIHIKKVIS